MTRAFTLVAVLALALAGCGDSADNGDGGSAGDGGGNGMDLAAPSGSDLGMTLPRDMQPAYGCHALAACRAACTGNSCAAMCNQSATSHARGLYQQVTHCVRNECFPSGDGGTAPCTQTGPPSQQCTTCQSDSLKMSGTCGGDTTYCGACATEYAACEADLP